jgi:hypothetical protein
MKDAMKNKEHETAMQQKAEAGEPWSNEEEHAYFLVFSAFKKQVEFQLPDSFAAKVTLLVHQHEGKKSRPWLEYILFAIGIILIFVAFATTVVLTGFKLNWGFLTVMHNYTGLFIMAAILIIAFNVIDIKIIQHQRK